MDDMESKMGAILGNPEMMQKIMAMAQSLNTTQESSGQTEQKQDSVFPNIDAAAIQKLAGLAGQSRIDKNQQGLLQALTPYLHQDRLTKLEKAMQAAKMATMASSLLGNSGFLSNFGR